MIAHRSPISGIASGPAGLVATAGYDNLLILWRDRRGVARACHDHLVNQCAFDADGRALVSASSDYTARVWSLPDLRLLAVLGDHEDDVEMAVFDPSGARVATASRDHRVRTFTREGALLHRFEGHEADVISVTWSRDGRTLVSSSDDGTVRWWDAGAGTLSRTVTLGAETDTVVVSPDGILFAGNDRGEIVNISGDGERRVRAHRAGIKRLALAPDGRFLVSSSYDRSLRVWVVEGGGLSPRCTTAMPGAVWARSVDFGPGDGLLMGTFGTSYALFDPSRDAWDLDGVADTPGLDTVHRAGRCVFTVGDAGRVMKDGVELARLGSPGNFVTTWHGRVLAGGHLGALYDCETGRVVHQHTSPLNCATVLENGDLLVGTYTGEGLVLAEKGGEVVLAGTLRLHDQAVKGVAASGNRVFSVSAAGDAGLHDFGPGPRSRNLPGAHDKIANAVCALADGRFASVSRDRKLRLWTDDRARAVPTPHAHSVKCVAATADGRRVATGAYDGTVALFDLDEGTWSPLVRPTCSGISSLCAAAEPDAVLASSFDGCVYRIDARGDVATLQGARSAA